MGTNYYAKVPITDTITETLHIGKKSAGWKFIFMTHPLRNIASRTDLLRFLVTCDIPIIDEYDRPVSFDDFMKVINVEGRQEVDEHRILVEGDVFYLVEFG